ncbi:hypothetical protein AY599_22760 [Leptolyngbya valderiana BDU 20041]|nr:hypothetical protein AY599_22760 [Leptolyngbya valderiana BDU 20041]
MMSVLALGGAVTMTGCGTIINGTTETISINSNPSGATVAVEGHGTVKTPATLELKRNRSHTLNFSLEGYENQTTTVRSGLSGWVFGNIIFGGIPGLIIDLVTGGWGNLEPNQVTVQLIPSDG